MSAFHIFKSVREYLTPVLTTSAFLGTISPSFITQRKIRDINLLNLEQGMLTPEEFVIAGDNLVRICPTWVWQSGEPSKRRPYLPAAKQYLSTSGVPCFHRVSSLQAANYVDRNIEGENGAEGWLAPELLPIEREVDDFDVIQADDAVPSDDLSSLKLEDPQPTASAAASGSAAKKSDDEYFDMEDDSLALDEATHPAGISSSAESSVIRSRRYDISITYDNYYRTPRIWLFGYNENGSPLAPEEIFQVSSICVCECHGNSQLLDV